MKTKSRSIIIHSSPSQIFPHLDDFSKTGMHMSESSMMMMGSNLTLEQLSNNATGIGATYRWFGKVMGMTIDFSETVTKWESPISKEWETIGDAKIIIMSWYKMWFNIIGNDVSSTITLHISYLPPKEWYFKILSFFFGDWYCNWCLKNMLQSTKQKVEEAR
jgi:hypothetical protein